MPKFPWEEGKKEKRRKKQTLVPFPPIQIVLCHNKMECERFVLKWTTYTFFISPYILLWNSKMHWPTHQFVWR